MKVIVPTGTRPLWKEILTVSTSGIPQHFAHLPSAVFGRLKITKKNKKNIYIYLNVHIVSNTDVHAYLSGGWESEGNVHYLSFVRQHLEFSVTQICWL